jgi:ligand-binding sensor domain-containing protein
MNKILIVLLFISAEICFAQNFWEPTNEPYAPGNVTAINAAKGGRIYVGIDGAGLYFSTDKGESFSYLHTALSNTSISAILIDPHGNIFVGNTNYNSNWSMFRSTDNRNHWSSLNSIR